MAAAGVAPSRRSHGGTAAGAPLSVSSAGSGLSMVSGWLLASALPSASSAASLWSSSQMTSRSPLLNHRGPCKEPLMTP